MTLPPPPPLSMPIKIKEKKSERNSMRADFILSIVVEWRGVSASFVFSS